MLKKTVVKKRAAPKKKLKVEKADPELDPKNWKSDSFELSLSSFPLCCALSIINNFPYQVNKGVDYKGCYGYYTKPGTPCKKDRWGNEVNNGVFEKMPPIVARALLKEQLEVKMKNVPQGMLIALNSYQTPCLEELVLEVGFKKVVGPFFYSGHRRDITIYFHPPMTGKKVESSIFG